jgi:hypothetical protein
LSPSVLGTVIPVAKLSRLFEERVRVLELIHGLVFIGGLLESSQDLDGLVDRELWAGHGKQPFCDLVGLGFGRHE